MQEEIRPKVRVSTALQDTQFRLRNIQNSLAAIDEKSNAKALGKLETELVQIQRKCAFFLREATKSKLAARRVR